MYIYKQKDTPVHITNSFGVSSSTYSTEDINILKGIIEELLLFYTFEEVIAMINETA